MAKLKTNELNNSILYNLFRKRFPFFKVYHRNDGEIEKIIIQKNKSVAIAAFVINPTEEKFVKSVIFEPAKTDSFFHNYILPFILFLLGAIPLIGTYLYTSYSRGELQEKCIFTIDNYYNGVFEDVDRNLHLK